MPAIHGIAGNNFIMQETGYNMYCTEDDNVATVGANSKAGQISPKNLLSSTITDELRMATNFQSKEIAIALKDRGTILPVVRKEHTVFKILYLISQWYNGLCI